MPPCYTRFFVESRLESTEKSKLSKFACLRSASAVAWSFLAQRHELNSGVPTGCLSVNPTDNRLESCALLGLKTRSCITEPQAAFSFSYSCEADSFGGHSIKLRNSSPPEYPHSHLVTQRDNLVGWNIGHFTKDGLLATSSVVVDTEVRLC